MRCKQLITGDCFMLRIHWRQSTVSQRKNFKPSFDRKSQTMHGPSSEVLPTSTLPTSELSQWETSATFSVCMEWVCQTNRCVLHWRKFTRIFLSSWRGEISSTQLNIFTMCEWRTGCLTISGVNSEWFNNCVWDVFTPPSKYWKNYLCIKCNLTDI